MTYTYFIQGAAGGPIKVGSSYDPERRRKDLQTGNHDELRVVATLRGNYEKWLHKEYADLCVRGEWFDPTIIANIAERFPDAPLKRFRFCAVCGESFHHFPGAQKLAVRLCIECEIQDQYEAAHAPYEQIEAA